MAIQVADLQEEKEVQTFSRATGTFSASGDNTAILAAPGAGYRNVVKRIRLQNESSTASTVILKEGATAKDRIHAANQGDGINELYDEGDEWRLPANTALVPNLSDAVQWGYALIYFTEAV